MKDYLIILLFAITFTSCFNDYESQTIVSPSGNFKIKATVNRTDKSLDNYADVIIHLFDKNNKQLSELTTGAGDFNKWAIGWTEIGDTIVMQSSDIGNKAWVLKNKKITEINMTNHLNKRAEYLYLEKYQ